MKRMIIGTLVVILGLGALLFVAGCATMWRGLSFDVIVDSLASDRAGQHRRYVMLPGVEGVTWEDLQFQEYAQYVRRALQIRGFQPAGRAEDADVAIVLSYGIGDPQTQYYSYSLPAWGRSWSHGTVTAFGGTATYSGTTTYTGSSTHLGSVTTYARYARMMAYDLAEFRATNKQVELWRTTVTSSGTSVDLRWIFPILAAAAAPYLSSDTGQQVLVRLDESDEAAREAVRAIRGLKPGKDVVACAERVRKTVETVRETETVGGVEIETGRMVQGYPHKGFDAFVGFDSRKPITWGLEKSRLLFEKCLADKGWTLK